MSSPTSIPFVSATFMLQIVAPDNRWLNVTTYDGMPTLCVNDGTGGTKWTISLLPDLKYYSFKADDDSFLCPAPVPSSINLYHRTDVAYGWQLEAIGTNFKIVDPVSTLAVAVGGVNGIQLADKASKGLVFRPVAKA